jgi:hypothetical protein
MSGRRATSTSFGAPNGNNTNPPGRKTGGSLPRSYYERLRVIAERTKTVKAVETILADPTHPQFSRVWAETMDRGFGKVTQPVQQDGDVSVTVRFVHEASKDA